MLSAYLNRSAKVKKGGTAWERILHENAHLCTHLRELAEATKRPTPWTP
jgi:hypothetical protein